MRTSQRLRRMASRSVNKQTGVDYYGPEATSTEAITKEQFESMADFRYAIRRSLRLSEELVRRIGVTPQQYQLLLAVKGFPQRDFASVSELSERLQLQQHSTVGLIDRTEALGLVRREQGTTDRRQVFIHLTPAGEALLCRLVVFHREELQHLHISLTPDGKNTRK